MKARDFFARARAAERDIQRLERLREHYLSVGGAISSKWGGIGGGKSGNQSKVEIAVLGAYEAERGILDELAGYRTIVAEAENIISRVPSDRFREILTLHYLTGMALADVGERLNYKDRNSIYRAHGWALSAAQKILDGRRENEGTDRQLSREGI